MTTGLNVHLFSLNVWENLIRCYSKKEHLRSGWLIGYGAFIIVCVHSFPVLYLFMCLKNINQVKDGLSSRELAAHEPQMYTFLDVFLLKARIAYVCYRHPADLDLGKGGK